MYAKEYPHKACGEEQDSTDNNNPVAPDYHRDVTLYDCSGHSGT
jgi:hypothetical protein